MTLATDEFIRRFLIHVLPSGFHRIRHYGLLANHVRVRQLAHVRALLDDSRAAPVAEIATIAARVTATFVCRTCGAAMTVIEILLAPRARAPPASCH